VVEWVDTVVYVVEWVDTVGGGVGGYCSVSC